MIFERRFGDIDIRDVFSIMSKIMESTSEELPMGFKMQSQHRSNEMELSVILDSR